MRSLGEDGFTALELLAACILFSAIIIPSLFLLHPKTYKVQMRNGERVVAIAGTMQAIHAYVRVTGSLPSDIPSKMEPIGTASNQVNLCNDLAPDYAKRIPTDPFFGDYINCATEKAYETGLAIQKTGKGTQVTIASLGSEGKLVYFTD